MIQDKPDLGQFIITRTRLNLLFHLDVDTSNQHAELFQGLAFLLS